MSNNLDNYKMNENIALKKAYKSHLNSQFQYLLKSAKC